MVVEPLIAKTNSVFFYPLLRSGGSDIYTGTHVSKNTDKYTTDTY